MYLLTVNSFEFATVRWISLFYSNCSPLSIFYRIRNENSQFNSSFCKSTKNSQMQCNFLPWSRLFLHKHIRYMYIYDKIGIYIYSLLTFNKWTEIIYYFCHRVNSNLCLMCKAEKSNGRAKTPRPVAPPPLPSCVCSVNGDYINCTYGQGYIDMYIGHMQVYIMCISGALRAALAKSGWSQRGSANKMATPLQQQQQEQQGNCTLGSRSRLLL